MGERRILAVSMLATYLKTKAPLIWVTSDEPARVTSFVTATVRDRPVYRYEHSSGLKVFRPGAGWKIVMVDGDLDDNGDPEPPRQIRSRGEALSYVDDTNGVFILEHAHVHAPMLIPFLAELSGSWIDSYYDTKPDLGSSIIMVSHSHEIPPEIARATLKVDYALPGVDEIGTIIDFVTHAAGLPVPAGDRRAGLIRANLGLSEYETLANATASLATLGHLDADYLTGAKIKVLAAGGRLQIIQPRLSLDDIGGLDQAKSVISTISWLWHHPSQAAEFDIDQPIRRVVMIGVPGSGKSALCEATARALGLELVKFGAGQFVSMYYGQSEANTRAAFAQVKVMAPVLLWVDEGARDLSGGSSSDVVDGGTTDRVHAEWLQGIQELPDNVFLMMAANSIDGLPPEMLRADRVDEIFFVGFPTVGEREEIFRIHLGAHHQRFDVDRLAAQTRYYTGAEIKAAIKATRFAIAGTHHRVATTEDILAYLPQMRHRVWVTHNAQIRAMYTRAATDWRWASTAQQAEATALMGASTGSSSGPHRQAPTPNTDLYKEGWAK